MPTEDPYDGPAVLADYDPAQDHEPLIELPGADAEVQSPEDVRAGLADAKPEKRGRATWAMLDELTERVAELEAEVEILIRQSNDSALRAEAAELRAVAEVQELDVKHSEALEAMQAAVRAHHQAQRFRIARLVLEMGVTLADLGEAAAYVDTTIDQAEVDRRTREAYDRGVEAAQSHTEARTYWSGPIKNADGDTIGQRVGSSPSGRDQSVTAKGATYGMGL